MNFRIIHLLAAFASTVALVDADDLSPGQVIAVASEFIGLEEVAQDSGSCDLVAQGFLLAPGSIAMASLQNQGGCRASIEEGDFTVEDANALLPFPDMLILVVMTGEQIKNVLEDAVQFYLDPDGSTGAYPRASGLRFDVNEAQPMGTRVSNLEFNNRLAGSWEAIDMSDNYQLVTNDFLASGNDGYYQFGDISNDLKLPMNMTSEQTFIDYAMSVEILEPVPEGWASTQMWSDELPETEGPETKGNVVFGIIGNMVTLMVDIVEVLPQMLNIVTDIVAAPVRTVSRLLG